MEHIHELLFDLVDQIKPQTSSNISRNSSVANIKGRHYKSNRNLSLVYFLHMSCPLFRNLSYRVMSNECYFLCFLFRKKKKKRKSSPHLFAALCVWGFLTGELLFLSYHLVFPVLKHYL